MIRALVNGHATDTIQLSDRSLHYGDGIFETIAILNGKPEYWDLHLKRLFLGGAKLKIPLPDLTILEREIEQILWGVQTAVLKVILSRGSGGRGYRIPDKPDPTRILIIYPWPDYPLDYILHGVTARICSMRLSRNTYLAGIKHLNRLEHIIARSEWCDSQIVEGIMLDTEDNVIEGTMSNLFLVKNDNLFTPDLSYCGVQGIMRSIICQHASELGVTVTTATISLEQLIEAEALFFTNSIIRIWPINRLIAGQIQVTKSLNSELLNNLMNRLSVNR